MSNAERRERGGEKISATDTLTRPPNQTSPGNAVYCCCCLDGTFPGNICEVRWRDPARFEHSARGFICSLRFIRRNGHLPKHTFVCVSWQLLYSLEQDWLGKGGIKKEGEKDPHSNALYTNIGVMLDRSPEVGTDEAGPACLHSHYQKIQIEASGEMGRTDWGHFLWYWRDTPIMNIYSRICKWSHLTITNIATCNGYTYIHICIQPALDILCTTSSLHM